MKAKAELSEPPILKGYNFPHSKAIESRELGRLLKSAKSSSGLSAEDLTVNWRKDNIPLCSIWC